MTQWSLREFAILLKLLSKQAGTSLEGFCYASGTSEPYVMGLLRRQKFSAGRDWICVVKAAIKRSIISILTGTTTEILIIITRWEEEKTHEEEVLLTSSGFKAAWPGWVRKSVSYRASSAAAPRTHFSPYSTGETWFGAWTYVHLANCIFVVIEANNDQFTQSNLLLEWLGPAHQQNASGS